MSDTAALHERLLAVEREARAVMDALHAPAHTDLELPASIAFPLIALSEAIGQIDGTRDAIDARQRLEGRWAS